MKIVNVNKYQIGLVFKHGAYQRMLLPGAYWFRNIHGVRLYSLTERFVAPVELNILLEDAALAALMDVVEVKDGQIMLQYENGLLKEVLTAGRYAFWKSPVRYSFVTADVTKTGITEPIDREILYHKAVQPFVRTINVAGHEKGLLFRDGKFEQVLDSGVYHWWKNSTILQVVTVDMRQQHTEINGQEMLTRDKVALRINAWARYEITDVTKTVMRNKDYEKQLHVIFQLALREYIGGFSFDELLDKKDAMSPLVLERVRAGAESLGIEVSVFGIRDIILPGDIREIMNQVLVAEKKAQANMILRREETATVRSQLNTAKLLEDNAMLWKLKEMEYVEKIADKISHISVNGNGVLIEQLRQIFSPDQKTS